MKRGIAAASLTALALMVGAPSALADPNSTQYDNPSQGVAQEEPKVEVKGAEAEGAPESTPEAATEGGTLPFTGLDLGLALAAGAGAVAGGFGLRRLGRRSAE